MPEVPTLWIQGQSSCEEMNKEKSSNLAYFPYLHTPGEWLTDWLTEAGMAVKVSFKKSEKIVKAPPISTDGSTSS